MKRNQLLIMAVCIYFVLTTLAWVYAAESEPRYGGVLRTLESGGPSDDIGWLAGRRPGGERLQPVFEPLVRFDRNGNIHPHLATAWQVAPDKTSITLNLRKGVKFHDGSDFNAEVVKFNLMLQKESKKEGTSNWTSINVVDDYTIRINLSKYDNTLLGRLHGGLGSMLSSSAVKEKGVDWVKTHPIGTGPFKFVSFKRDLFVKFERNDNYWQKGKPYLDRLEDNFIREETTRVAAFEAGEIDVLGTDTPKVISDLKAKGFIVHTAPSGTVAFLLDSANADSPFADKRVREAVSYAIDRDAIVKARGFGFYKTAYQLPPKGTKPYISNFKGREYNPEKAKQLLAEAGYPNGFETKIIPLPMGIDRDVVIALQHFLGQIGIKVDLDFVTYPKYMEYRFRGWKNAILLQPLMMHANYNQSLQWYFAEDSPQFPSLKRPKGFQDAIIESLSTMDMDIPKMQKVIIMLHEHASVIPIHDTGRAYITQKNVQGTGRMEYSSFGAWRPEDAWLSK